jgi:UDP-N-acetyl-D-mannosaminuronic acid dehydrogenase/UDP-N-acetyl-D-glucosamine dehydrogenase
VSALRRKVVVVGQGYVGLPLAMRSVDVGHDVVGLEVDEERVSRLAAGESFVEDVSSAELATRLATERYLPTTSPEACKGFDVAVVTVPTPLHDGLPDLRFIEEAAATLAPLVSEGATVVLESTTYPGTTEELLVPILERGSGLHAGADFSVGYSPERIDPGNRTWTLTNTPKVVSGIDATSLERVADFYATVVDHVVRVSGTREAEMTKLLENTFRHVNIALVNELSMFANALGVDVWEAIDAASTKPFGYMPFTPGPGVGGHCLPIDPSYLSWKVEQSTGGAFRFVELANDINRRMPDYVLRRATQLLNDQERSVRGSRILVLGLAYKKNTGDMREAPGPVLCELLSGLGASVRAVDPLVDLEQVPASLELVALSEDELSAADLVIMITDHDAIDVALVARAASVILDTRHCLPASPDVVYL